MAGIISVDFGGMGVTRSAVCWFKTEVLIDTD